MDKTEKLYQKNLRALRREPVVMQEPVNTCPNCFEAVAGMGEHAEKNETLARYLRDMED